MHSKLEVGDHVGWDHVNRALPDEAREGNQRRSSFPACVLLRVVTYSSRKSQTLLFSAVSFRFLAGPNRNRGLQRDIPTSGVRKQPNQTFYVRKLPPPSRTQHNTIIRKRAMRKWVPRNMSLVGYVPSSWSVSDLICVGVSLVWLG